MQVKLRIIDGESKSPLPEPGKKDRACRKIIEYGLLALLVFSPLPAASVHEWSILVIEIWALFLTAVYFLLDQPPHINPKLSRRLLWPRYLSLGLFLFFVIQIIPLPKFMVQILSPRTFALQQQFSPRFSEMKFMSLSLVPSHTLREGLELLSYFLIGFLVVRTITRRRQIKRLMTVLVALGVFEAFYGLFELYHKNPRVLFYKKIYNPDSVSGTFINRNHFSGYIELIIPLAISLIISRIDLFSLAGMKWQEKISQITGKGVTTNFLLTLGSIGMSLAVILSNSRSGVLLLALTFMLFIELTILYAGTLRHRQVWVTNFLKVTFLIITLLALYVGIETTISRFSLDNLLQEGRPLYWTNLTEIVKDFPLLGTGLGTFASIYPAYEKIGIEGQLFHAHNDYLEYFSELGLIGFALLLGVILFIALDSFLTWKNRRNPEARELALGGIVAIVVMLVHSLTDFNLHIPANMLLFSVVLSLTFVTVYYRKS